MRRLATPRSCHRGLGMTGRAALLFFVGACSADTGPGPSPPAIGAMAIAANPHNVLAALVSGTARYTDSARVLYAPVDEGGKLQEPESSTGFSKIDGEAVRVLVLGLKPGTAYSFRVEAVGNLAATSAGMSYRTPDLPQDLLGVRLAVTGTPGSGFTLTELTRNGSAFIVAFDSAGRIAWYRGFPAEAGEMALDAGQRVNGNYTLFIGASTGWQPSEGRFVEVTAAGDFVRQYQAGPGYYTDPHELALEFRQNLLRSVNLFGYDFRKLNLAAVGGRSEQLVAGHYIIRLSPAGAVEFVWSAWDHFGIDEWLFVPPALAQMTSIDFDHPNSLDVDADGNYVASFASLGTVVKIDHLTGAFVWRLGGRKSDFKVIGDPLGGFGFQHDVRVLPNGNVLLFDNGLAHSPRESRAVEYRLDPAAKTATMVWEYRHGPPIFSAFAGSAQRLEDGGTLVAFGATPVVAEVSREGSVRWEGTLLVEGQPGVFMYRATHLATLDLTPSAARFPLSSRGGAAW